MNANFYDAPPPHESQAFPPPQGSAVVREMSTYMTDRDAEKVCQLFADGLRSGVGYSRILDFMERQKIDGKMTQRLRVAVLEYGDKLGEAFARFGVLDAPTRKLVLVAEEQGSLPDTFAEQARSYGARYKRKREFAIGMIEPALMFCLGTFFFGNIFGGMMDMTFGDYWATLGKLAGKSAIQSIIFFLFAGGVAYTWLNLPVDSAFREASGRLWFRMPVVSNAVRLQAIANFARFLRQSLRSGMDIFRSIELAAEASNSPWFMETVAKTHDVLEAGYPLDTAMRQLRGLPDDFVDYVAIGEETGRLEENLLFLANRYDERAHEAFKMSLAATVYFARFALIIGILVFAVFSNVLSAAFNF